MTPIIRTILLWSISRRWILSLVQTEPQIILDTGVDCNFTSAPWWQDKSNIFFFFFFNSIEVHKIAYRTCDPVVRNPAFGATEQVTTQIQLRITFQADAKTTIWCYLLPQKLYIIFISKAELFQLKYSLADGTETITVNNKILPIGDFSFATKYSSKVYALTHQSLLNTYKEKYPSLFSSSFSTELRHNYKAKVTLEIFPYTSPKAFYSSTAAKPAIKQYIEQSLENGLLVKTKSGDKIALSPVIPLQQSADKVRIITDLRQVNKHLQYTPRAIPTTQSILSELSSKTIFSAIDIRKAYQQLPITGDDIGIITEFGNFRYTRMPYGLASAPFWWGEFLQSIMEKLELPPGTVVHYYYDDIIVASASVSTHTQILDDLFALLAQNGLSISEEKLQLAVPKVLFLGYEISHNRIGLDPAKIETIQRWEMPTSKEGIMKFVGFVNYLRNFIPNASSLLMTLTRFAILMYL